MITQNELDAFFQNKAYAYSQGQLRYLSLLFEVPCMFRIGTKIVTFETCEDIEALFKTYRGNLRRILAEAMLGTGVICVEGVSDAEVLSFASDVLEEDADPGAYTPLDLSGVTIVQCEGDGSILRYGEFFKSLGKRTYAFYDKQSNSEIAEAIDALFDDSWELEQTGIEFLLAEEVVIKKFETQQV